MHGAPPQRPHAEAGVATESAPTSRPASRLAPACLMAATAIMAPLIRRVMAIGGSGGCALLRCSMPNLILPPAPNGHGGGCNRSC